MLLYSSVFFFFKFLHVIANSHNYLTHIVKFAESTCIIRVICKIVNEAGFRSEKSIFTIWCNENKLLLNVSKKGAYY